MPEIADADLLLRGYNMKEYCIGKGNQVVRDFPTPRLFRPDEANEVSLYGRSVWTEDRIRRHIRESRRRTRQGEVVRKDPEEFGLSGLSEAEVTEGQDYVVKREADQGTDLIPPNESHCIIVPNKGQDKDAVQWELYNMAVGFSPPPRLREVKGLKRCARWQLLREAET